MFIFVIRLALPNHNQSKTMNIREAVLQDIPRLQVIRNAVKENALSDPALVSDKDYEIYLLHKGKGWVYEHNGEIAGFAIVDLEGNNIWALFIHPLFERKGIGRKLHDVLLNWYFAQTRQTVWLGTAPGTRAENFYRRAGWKETGIHGKGEIKFEMSYAAWEAR